MKKFIAVFALAALALVNAKEFSYKTCGSNNAIKIHKFEIDPTTVTIPGDIEFNFDIELLRPVQSASVQLKVVRKSFFVDLTLPCVKNIGSCPYKEMCSIVDDMIREDWAGVAKGVASQILRPGQTKFDDGTCPRQPMRTGTIRRKVSIPKLPSILSFIAAGDYTGLIEITDNSDSSNVLCVEFEVTLKEANDGGVWGKRRKRSLRLA